MLVDGIKLFEGSSIQNASVDSGPTFPTLASTGELFFKTPENSLYVYSGSGWVAAGTGGGGGGVSDAGDLTGTTLATNVVSSSLTSVGTITAGTWAADFGTFTATTVPSAKIGSTGVPTLAFVADASSGSRASLLSAQNDGSITWTFRDDSWSSGTEFFTVTRGVGNLASSITLSSTAVNLAAGTGGLQINGAVGLAGQVITSGGPGAAATWAAPSTIAAAGTLTGTTLAANVVSSSLTSLGILSSLVVSGPATAAEPTLSTHLTTKSYVDAAVNGLSWKNAVRVATTSNITLSGTQTIDGVAVNAGNRVLVKNQTLPEQNGVYVVAAGAWVRSIDFDGAPDIGEINGAAVFVTEGVTHADTAWTQTATVTTVGTDPITFAQFSATAVAAAGTLTGTTLAANVVSSSLTSLGTLTGLSVNGIFNLQGGTSPLQAAGSAGTSGQVLTSAGPGATPIWASPTASSSANNLPRVTTISSAVVGKRAAVTTNQTITATTWAGGGAIAVGDAFSIYNDSATAITITAGGGLTMYRDGNATAVASVTLSARGSCFVWYNTVSEVVINGSIA